MDNILFRCSSAGALLTEPKAKAAKDAGQLSETAKSLVQSMWLQNTYGYREYLQTDAMTKGLECEQDSMELVQSVLGGQFRVKNRERLQNQYIIGTPDTILDDCIEDIKTSFNLRTFYEAEPTTLYLTQAQCYMELVGIPKYRLIYALIPNSPELIAKQCESLAYKFDKQYDNPDYIEQCEQIKHNNAVIETIPIEKRIKVYHFDFQNETIERLYSKIETAREYYKTLSL